MLTIFTPTYNRAHLLPRLFKSLKNQRNNNFVWLIIDDGSTDNTYKVVDEFKQESFFLIDYYYQENQGKPTATNNAINTYCNTEYFMVVDSDDFLVENIINFIYEKIKIINDNNLIVALGSPRKYINSNLLQINIPLNENVVSDPIELDVKYNIRGEFTYIFKTKILKHNQYPIFLNEKFIKESVVFNRISEFYKFLYLKESIVLAEYQTDGLSSNFYNLLKNNPKGAALASKEQMNNDNYPMIKRLDFVNMFWLFESIIGRKNFIQKLLEIKSFKLKLYFLKNYISSILNKIYNYLK